MTRRSWWRTAKRPKVWAAALALAGALGVAISPELRDAIMAVLAAVAE